MRGETTIDRSGAGEVAIDELTERQLAVLSLMAKGRSNQAIAEVLSLTPKTVEAHIRSIFVRLDLQPSEHDHRRVLAVLTYLQRSADEGCAPAGATTVPVRSSGRCDFPLTVSAAGRR